MKPIYIIRLSYKGEEYFSKSSITDQTWESIDLQEAKDFKQFLESKCPWYTFKICKVEEVE